MASKHPDYIHYNHDNVQLAKALRRDMTPSEKRLWYGWLRNLPFRFQRQKPIGDYIVDFYCHKAKLVVEIDGWRHFTDKGQEQDAKRTEFLETLGLRVLRFKGHEVDNCIEGVAAQIEAVAKARIAELGGESLGRHTPPVAVLPQPASPAAPSRRGQVWVTNH